MASPSPGDRLWRAKECPQPAEKRNVPNCRLEGTEEDGVGSGFAELELVAGIELGGTAGLDLNADARGPVYHHGSVGGRQVLNMPDILSIAPDMGMAGRDIVADVGNIALTSGQRANLNTLLTRLNPARGAHDKLFCTRSKPKGCAGAGSRSPAVIDMPSERGVEVPPPQVACA